MALYYDAAAILSSVSSTQGSLRSRVYDSNANLKSSPPLVRGLIAECAKWDAVLSEVIDNSGILSLEPKVCDHGIRHAVALLTDTEAVGLAHSAPCSTSRP